MGTEQLKEFNHLTQLEQELTKKWIKYWNQYSGFDNWHFWALIILSILPLVVLFFLIDRRRMFQLGFFGFTMHILHSYVDTASVHLGKWAYPYKLIPFYKISFAFDASFIPVTFMLVYQWTLNHKKNFYLYSMIPAFFFGFIAKPILVASDITRPGPKGGGFKAYFILFVSHLFISYIAKWVTDLFKRPLLKEDYNKQILENEVSMSQNWFRVRRED